MRVSRVATVAFAGFLVGSAAWAESSLKRTYPDPSLDGPPIHFTAKLSADEESTVVESPGTGAAEFTLDRQSAKLSWKITYKDLTSPITAARMHGPQTPGGEAGALFDLAGKGLKSPLEGSHTLTDGELRYLLTDRMYVQITTTKYKDGEIRGQLQRLRPEAARSP